MSRKFRFTGECLDRLKEYYARLSGGKAAAPDSPEGAQAEPAVEDAPAGPVQEERAQAEAEIVDPLRATEGKTTSITRTDIGRVRASNQDALIDAWPLLGVADGMGGHQGGEVASASARDLLIQLLKGKEPDPQALRTAITAVNKRLFIRQGEEKELAGMGTTLTVLWAGKEDMLIGHVGDSRAYRLRDGEWRQMTADHSMVAEMMREGLLTQEQAACHPMRNVITRAVGTEEGVDADILTEKRCRGDVWLVCSDGLHGMVDDERLADLLRHNDPEKAADLMLQAALEAGGRDNISLAILVDGEDPA